MVIPIVIKFTIKAAIKTQASNHIKIT